MIFKIAATLIPTDWKNLSLPTPSAKANRYPKFGEFGIDP
jgi:hypothetical protein